MISPWLRKKNGRKWFITPKAIELSIEAEADILLACQEAHFYGIETINLGSEISGLGHVKNNDFTLFISDIIIPEQTNSRIHTALVHGDMERIQALLREAGKHADEYICWWHSHVTGDAVFSDKDELTIGSLLPFILTDVHLSLLAKGKDVPEETYAGPFVSIVANVQKEMFARCDFIYRNGGHYETQRNENIPIIRKIPALTDKERLRIRDERYPRIQQIVRDRLTLTFVDIRSKINTQLEDTL
ncbi:MAG: Mov34/MPN/PAD-1 family protein [Candidatus Niyogibacteria bacterium]|nr:Mov34/MPN/PAD-1 family protein [Candidatus Niyogibacteria bacterium]